MLASLPVRLSPGEVLKDDPERASVIWVIGGAWLALGVVALALGSLLSGALALDARRGAFVSAVTHELRTPLTTFKLYAEMLEEGMVPEGKQQEYLATLRREANRLGALVENVLAYAQVEKGRPAKPLTVVPLPELLEPILERLRARAEASGFSLELAAPVPSLEAIVERLSVEQILFNLVDNACKYAASTEPKQLTLSFDWRGSTLVIAVVDRGPGVAADVKHRIFEPFRKSAAEAAEGAPGIGLGLALSRHLARAMGGDLVHRPTPVGARFELKLKLRVTQQ